MTYELFLKNDKILTFEFSFCGIAEYVTCILTIQTILNIGNISEKMEFESNFDFDELGLMDVALILLNFSLMV